MVKLFRTAEGAEMEHAATSPYTGQKTSNKGQQMTSTTKAVTRWVESISLSRLFALAKDPSHPAHRAALNELVDRLTRIAIDGLMTHHEHGHQPASPIASVGAGSASTSKSPLNSVELAAMNSHEQDTVTRLALDLLTWLKPKQAINLLFNNWAIRKGLTVSSCLNSHWDKALAELQLSRWFTPDQLKQPKYRAVSYNVSNARKGYTQALLHIIDPDRNPAPPKAAGRIAKG